MLTIVFAFYHASLWLQLQVLISKYFVVHSCLPCLRADTSFSTFCQRPAHVSCPTDLSKYIFYLRFITINCPLSSCRSGLFVSLSHLWSLSNVKNPNTTCEWSPNTLFWGECIKSSEIRRRFWSILLRTW